MLPYESNKNYCTCLVRSIITQLLNLSGALARLHWLYHYLSTHILMVSPLVSWSSGPGATYSRSDSLHAGVLMGTGTLMLGVTLDGLASGPGESRYTPGLVMLQTPGWSSWWAIWLEGRLDLYLIYHSQWSTYLNIHLKFNCVPIMHSPKRIYTKGSFLKRESSAMDSSKWLIGP